MTTVVLARHGATGWSDEGRYTGSTDVALTPAGVEQAEALAHWCQLTGADTLWSSGLTRAVATARAVSTATGLAVGIDDRLRELDFGEAEGMTRSELRARWPVEVAAFEDDPWASPLPGGEPPAAATRRAMQCLETLTCKGSDRRVVVVTHSTLIRLVVCAATGIPPQRYRRALPGVHNCSVTLLERTVGDWALEAYNCPTSDGPVRALHVPGVDTTQREE